MIVTPYGCIFTSNKVIYDIDRAAADGSSNSKIVSIYRAASHIETVCSYIIGNREGARAVEGERALRGIDMTINGQGTTTVNVKNDVACDGYITNCHVARHVVRSNRPFTTHLVGHSIGNRRPLGIECYRCVCCRCQVTHLLIVIVYLVTVSRCCPSVEGKAIAGIAEWIEMLSLIVVKRLIFHLALATILVEDHSIGNGRPVGVKRLITGRIKCYLCTVVINLVTVGRCSPSVESIALAAESAV